jgi:hypothetical protein
MQIHFLTAFYPAMVIAFLMKHIFLIAWFFVELVLPFVSPFHVFLSILRNIAR